MRENNSKLKRIVFTLSRISLTGINGPHHWEYSRFILFALILSGWVLQGCIPIGMLPTPRMLRKNPELRLRPTRPAYPDSVLPYSHLIEFPYRNIMEIRLSWKVVAGLKLKSREIKALKELILGNVRQYWQYRYPGKVIPSISLENVSVKDAQILLSRGYPLLLYSAYDIKHRRRPYSFEGFDVCIGYRDRRKSIDDRVSFKLNSGLRGYIPSQSMLTGTLLDVPRLKNSKVQVLQVVLLMPPGKKLEDVYKLLHKTYKAMGKSDYTLPVEDEMHPVGSIR